jgi:hypothetical protein
MIVETAHLFYSGRRGPIYAIRSIALWVPTKETFQPDYTVSATDLFWKLLYHASPAIDRPISSRFRLHSKT